MDALVPARDEAGQPRGPGARLVLDYLPLVAVAIAYLAVRHAVLGGVAIAEDVIAPLDNPLVPITTLPLGERLGATSGQALMTPFAVILEYARLLVWPARLSPDYSYNQIPLVTSALDGRFLAGVIITAGCIARHRRAVAPQPDCGLWVWRCWLRRSPSSATSSSRSAPSARNGSCTSRVREPPSQRESRPRR